MNSKKILLVLAFLFFFVISAYAQGESPEEVARVSMESMNKGDWSAYVRLMHPDTLAVLKKLLRVYFTIPDSDNFAERLFGVKNSKEYDALSDIAVAEALLNNMTKQLPFIAETMRLLEYSIIGSVREGEDLAHVVYRTNTKEGPVSKVEVMSLRRYQGRWRIASTEDIRNITEFLPKLRKLEKLRKPEK